MEDGKNEYYESLFLRMLRDDISPGEYEALEVWFLDSAENRNALVDLYRANYALAAGKRGKRIDPAAALRRMNDKVRSKARRRRMRIAASVAACAAVLTGGVLIFDRLGADADLQPAAENIVPDARVALVFSDNSVLAFDGEEPIIAYDGQGRIVAGDSASDTHEVPLENTTVKLVVPKGKRSNITLPDGTVVWVNSDSRLVFPAKFDSSREVTVDGEVYLQVLHDRSRPFTVHTKNFDVSVLGTSFNVRAYENNDSQSVMLQEGSVSVIMEDRSETVLVPSQMLTYDKGGISVNNVNTDDHISWITGVYRFRSEKLRDIADRLVNYYGTPVVFSSEALASRRFSGKLEFSESADFVYGSIAQAASLQYINHGDRIEFREPSR